MTYLLDTDTCIHALKGRPRVIERLRATPRAAVAVSAITVAELRTGAAKSSDPDGSAARVDRFLAPLAQFDFTPADAPVYARIRASLERRGEGIGALDTLIAAHAVARGATLVTGNAREFSRVPGLALEDWSKG